jgi:hypothetical protein
MRSAQTHVRRLRFMTYRGRLLGVAVAFVMSALAMAATSAAAAAADFTWTGAAPVGTPDWSNATNWGGSAPSGSVGTLVFPVLTSAACTANSPTATCYASNNNVTGLSVNELSFDILNSYGVITGDAITLGGGGLNGGTTASTGQSVSLGFPITLGAPQTWSLTGNAAITVEAPITGTLEAFTLQTSANASLAVSSDVEAGTVTIASGGGGGEGAIVYGSGSVLGVEGELNATDGNTIAVNGSTLGTVSGGGASEVGPLAVSNGGNVYIGDPGSPGILHVSGGATFDSSSGLTMYVGRAGTTAGGDYSQLSATGAVDLGGVPFGLAGNAPGGSCLALNPGDVMTILTTTGTLTGTFSGVPNGTTVSVGCDGGSGTPPTVTINYTAHTVTATVTGSSPPPPPPPPGKLLSSTSVSCSLDTQTTVDCGATVSDTSDGGSTPTGEVDFSSGGVGTLLSSVCQLAPVPFEAGAASCTVQYMPPDTSSSLVTAAYQGDSTFNPSSGSQRLIPGEIEETDCEDSCSDNQISYPSEVLPGQTTQTVTTKNGTKADEDEDDDWETHLTSADFDGPGTQAETDAQDDIGAGLTDEQRAELADGIVDPPTYPSSQAGQVSSTVQQGLGDQEQLSPSDASKLESTDSDLSPDFPPDDSGDAGDTSDLSVQRASAASVNFGPAASLVLASIYAKHPTAAEVRAFDQELALATAPTYSPARAVARITLVFAQTIGIHVIAHDLGYKRLSQLHGKAIVLGSVGGKLKKRHKTKLTIKASALGGRILRVLDVVGLSHKVTIELKVSITPKGKHKAHSITRPIGVI